MAGWALLRIERRRHRAGGGDDIVVLRKRPRATADGRRLRPRAKEATATSTTPERTTMETMWARRRTRASVGGGSKLHLLIENKIEFFELKVNKFS